MFNFFKKQSESCENEKESSAQSPKGAYEAFKNAVTKTSDALIGNILGIVSKNKELDEFILEDIEDALIKADIGADFAVEIVEKLKKSKIGADKVKDFLREEFENLLNATGSNKLSFFEDKLNIYFVTGVNGVGKTTLIGKLANRMKNEGKKVLLAAGDTFRAAAEEQLEIWSKRAGVEILRDDGADPASVVYRAIDKANSENYNVLIVDTAGRLQNKFNLIEELKKVRNVIDKKAFDANVESILVLDANLGQNGLAQAKVFMEAVNLTGCALTKLDGSSKGGIILAVAKEHKIPVKLVGIGEKIDDLKDFNREEFIEAIFNF